MLSQVETARAKLVCLQLALCAPMTPQELTDVLDLPLTAVLPLLRRLESAEIVERTSNGYGLAPAA